VLSKNLREYIEKVDSFGELKRVEGADWDLEIGGIRVILRAIVYIVTSMVLDVVLPRYSTWIRL
jgi:hypothetical protein